MYMHIECFYLITLFLQIANYIQSPEHNVPFIITLWLNFISFPTTMVFSFLLIIYLCFSICFPCLCLLPFNIV